MGQITAEVIKQREGPTGYHFDYRLRQVTPGQDQDGDAVTTCLVEPTQPAEVGRVDVTETARKGLSILDQTIAALQSGDSGMSKLPSRQKLRGNREAQNAEFKE